MEKTPIEIFKSKLGKRMRQLRKANKITQKKIAFDIGYKDKQVVNNYEINGANPTAYNLVLIAKALGVTVDELLDFSKLE
ncbi:MAG: helix-turn-helix transcriptional regulator [Bacteroidota bacterium]